MAIQIVCADCGSPRVTRDAWAEWDAAAQGWRLGAVFDDGFCHQCETWATLEERLLRRDGEEVRAE